MAGSDNRQCFSKPWPHLTKAVKTGTSPWDGGNKYFCDKLVGNR